MGSQGGLPDLADPNFFFFFNFARGTVHPLSKRHGTEREWKPTHLLWCAPPEQQSLIHSTLQSQDWTAQHLAGINANIPLDKSYANALVFAGLGPRRWGLESKKKRDTASEMAHFCIITSSHNQQIQDKAVAVVMLIALSEATTCSVILPALCWTSSKLATVQTALS